MNRDATVLLKDILQSINQIKNYTWGLNADDS